MMFAMALGVASHGRTAMGQTGMGQTGEAASGLFEVRGGRGSIQLSRELLDGLGLNLESERSEQGTEDGLEIGFRIPGSASFQVIELGRTFGTFSNGSAALRGEMTLVAGTFAFSVRDPELAVVEGMGGTVWTVSDEGVEVLRLLSPNLAELDAGSGRVHWGDVSVLLGEGVGDRLGMADAAGATLGSFLMELAVVPSGRVAVDEAGGHPAGSSDHLGTGPDVIVGDLPGTSNWGVVGGIRAYSVATTSCNIGNQNLDWISGNNQHPVIGQNLYRFKNGRFEMIGQSWLKHGFFALSGSLCFNDCQSTNGTELGVHCSDPYSSSLNGSRDRLGPKYQVNATTGFFNYPPAQPGSDGTIGRRLQVQVTDVDPAQNAGARYFVEGHYITPDDAAAGNGLNNASYREVVISGGSFNLNVIGSTVRELAAVNVYPTLTSGVVAGKQDVPGDGRFTVMSKVTDLGGGFYNYEYAVHNLNSHRSGQSFSVPMPAGATVQNIGFHDVDYHSGEPFSGADWTATVQGGAITFATQTFAENANANALRWGTLYNFRFDCDVAPEAGSATVGLFRPGAPDDVAIIATVPVGGPPVERADLAIDDVEIDYDPADGDVDAGPGVLGQAVDTVITVRNLGNVPVVSASLELDAFVEGGTLLQKSLVVDDFDPAVGLQSLAPGASAAARISFPAGELDRCGTYTLLARHDGLALESLGMGGPLFGDEDASNDGLEDHPDEDADPGDDFSPDLLELDFGTIVASVIPASEIIESLAEKVRVDLDYTGLGPGMDSHDVRLVADLTNLAGDVVYLGVLAIDRPGVRSSGSKQVRIRLDLSTLFPTPGPGSEYRVRLRLRDTSSSEICISTLTGNSFLVQ
jgi:hypothetical protein